MITAAIAILLLNQDRPQPGDLISRMLAHYNSLNTVSGTLKYSQSAKDSDGKTYSAHGQTTVQIEKPGKLYIYQTADSGAPGRIVSNGVRFLYDPPQDTRGAAQLLGKSGQQNAELVEDVVQWDYDKQGNVTMPLGQMYSIGREGLPLHPAAPLDILISNHGDLVAFKDQLSSLVDQGDATIYGQKAHLVGGDWRQYADAPVSGTYQMAITDAGDLLRFVLKETVSDSGLSANGAVVTTPNVEVTTTWDVDLMLNGRVDEKLFQDKAIAPKQKGGDVQNNVMPSGGSGKPPL